MSDDRSHDLEAFEAMVPVIMQAVPQEDILAAVTCYVGTMISRAEDPDEVRTAVDEILHRHGVPTRVCKAKS